MNYGLKTENLALQLNKPEQKRATVHSSKGFFCFSSSFIINNNFIISITAGKVFELPFVKSVNFHGGFCT